MKVEIRQVDTPEKEQVVLECMEMTKEFEDIRDYASAKGECLSGYKDGRELYRIRRRDILYVEAVGELVFAYARNQVVELKMRLYEAEELLKQDRFVRCSKSILVNLLKIEWIKPALNGRFCAHMVNEEEIIISRQYAKDVKRYIMEDLV